MSGKTGSGFINEEKGEEFVSVVGFADQDAADGRGYGGFEAKEMMKEYFGGMGVW